jgi:ent-kaurene synthase
MTCIYLLQRESSQGKLDSVSLLVLHSDGSVSIEEAKESIRRSIATCRKDMMRLVLKEDSVVPRSCREMFWKMAKICYVFYSDTDGFTSPTEMMSRTNAVIHDPLQLQASNPSLTVQSEQ